MSADPWEVWIERNAAESCRRGPGDEECLDYTPGREPHLNAQCETDGHYLCAGCVFNVHRVPDHFCRDGGGTEEGCARGYADVRT